MPVTKSTIPDPAAKWIWLPEYNDYYHDTPGKFVLFRKSINIKDVSPTQNTIHVSGDTRYRVYVNGKSVCFGPCKSYPGRWYFDTVDISECLRPGDNIISVKVLRFSAAQIGSTSIMKAPIPGLIIWGNIGGEPIVTDQSWRCAQDDSIRLLSRAEWNYLLGPPFLSLEEDVDLGKYFTDWQSPGFDDSSWPSATISSMVTKMMPALEPWKLVQRPIPLLPEVHRQFKTVLKPAQALDDLQSLISGSGEFYVSQGQTIDFEIESEQLVTAFLTLTGQGGRGTEVKIVYAESYEKDLGIQKSPFPRPRSKADRRDYTNGRLYGFEDRIILNGGVFSYEPFWFRTFRFIRISVRCAEEPLRLTSVGYRETYYPLEVTTSISLPPQLEKLWDISCLTLKNCMHETYEDCPYYEQNQFAMDARLQMLFTYQLSRDDRLARKTIHEFHASRREDGLLETNYPVSFRAINIPQFSLFWILMIHDHMMYFGDASLVRTYIGTVDAVLNHFDSLINDDGLMGAFDPECWAFVDWVKEWQGSKGIRDMAVPPIYKKNGVATYNSLVYAYVLQHAAQLCDFISRADTAREYRGKAAQLNTAINKHCFDGTLYTDGPGTSDVSQHSQIFAILSGAIAGGAAQELVRRALDDKTIPQCSFAMKFYIFRALEKVGLYEQYFPVMIEPWHKMVENNLTTCPEDDVNFRSDCHGWSASPIYEFVAMLYGVKPISPAQTVMKIEPRQKILEEGRITIGMQNENKFEMNWAKSGKIEVCSSMPLEAQVVLQESRQTVRLEANSHVWV